MRIKKVFIKNLTVFEENEIEFSKGINILLGTNGVGKTHLLKFLYAFFRVSGDKRMSYSGGLLHGKTFDVFGVLYRDLIRDFMKESYVIAHTPLDFDNEEDILAEIMPDIRECVVASNHEKIQKKCSDMCSYFYITPSLEQGKEPSGLNRVEFFLLNGKISAIKKSHVDIFYGSKIKSAFIMSKEFLSHSKGFLPLAGQYVLPFDITYTDILEKVQMTPVRELSDISDSLFEILYDIIDGEVKYTETGQFYVEKKDGRVVPFELEAEGYRKFGLLMQLIKNGWLDEGSLLFWDEPEANINPELIPKLVDFICMLSRSGVQIFLATHNYNVAKWFELMCSQDESLMFHNMTMTNNGVSIDSTQRFPETNNSIIKADVELLEKIYKDEIWGQL